MQKLAEYETTDPTRGPRLVAEIVEHPSRLLAPILGGAADSSVALLLRAFEDTGSVSEAHEAIRDAEILEVPAILYRAVIAGLHTLAMMKMTADPDAPAIEQVQDLGFSLDPVLIQAFAKVDAGVFGTWPQRWEAVAEILREPQMAYKPPTVPTFISFHHDGKSGLALGLIEYAAADFGPFTPWLGAQLLGITLDPAGNVWAHLDRFVLSATGPTREALPESDLGLLGETTTEPLTRKLRDAEEGWTVGARASLIHSFLGVLGAITDLVDPVTRGSWGPKEFKRWAKLGAPKLRPRRVSRLPLEAASAAYTSILDLIQQHDAI
tara:strand:- start:1306 stop:2274 length:969 start_codon:yes stop_codon:yes gene_type:complete